MYVLNQDFDSGCRYRKSCCTHLYTQNIQLELISGNQKFAFTEAAATFVAALCAKSIGNMLLFESCTDTFHGLRCDTDAPDSEKVSVTCYRYQFAAQRAFFLVMILLVFMPIGLKFKVWQRSIQIYCILLVR